VPRLRRATPYRRAFLFLWNNGYGGSILPLERSSPLTVLVLHTCLVISLPWASLLRGFASLSGFCYENNERAGVPLTTSFCAI
jgi:hypothetical protein